MEIRILHVDDEDITRAGIRSLLADSALHLVGSADGELEAFRLSEERFPDILLLNIQAKAFDGVRFLTEYRQKFPRQKVVILTHSNEPYYLMQAAGLGVRDYVLTNVSAMNLTATIQNIYYNTGTSQNAAWNDILRMQKTQEFQELRLKLTRREEEVLRHLALGASNKEIAVQLGISPETVKEHIQRILNKVGVHGRTEAAVWAVRKGLV